jgi:hypothetical protein
LGRDQTAFRSGDAKEARNQVSARAHFEIYVGKLFEPVFPDQVDFLERHL